MSLKSKPKFKYNWRNYQKSVLDNFKSFKEDKHVHIIAPPGSGKTILGLEMMLKLNQSTLILSPTVAIRNQWKDRLLEDFESKENLENFISTKLESPEFITITTYQNFFSKFKNGEIPKDYFKVLVLDEAHHLMNAWYKALDKFKSENDVYTLSLTATPPYDSPLSEWENYLSINGEVDMEISVPELIKEQNLCPHQDYIYYSFPTEEELGHLRTSYEKQQKALEFLSKNDDLTTLVQKQNWFQNPEENLDTIYNSFEQYTATLIYLNNAGIPIDSIHFEILGYGKEDEIIFPTLTSMHIEQLVNILLFQEVDFYFENEERITKLTQEIRKLGVIENKKLELRFSRNAYKKTMNSASKIKSISEIIEFEKKHQSNLNALVLTDFIRKEYFEKSLKIDKIGVVPIFRYLFEKNADTQLGVLCGSFAIVPKSTISEFSEYPINELKEYPGYYIVTINEANKNAVQAITSKLFSSDKIDVLIGTKSLLGEGWDAPFVNTVILASQAATFVSINQMRGRAIRIEKENPDKIAHIWHLVGINPYDEAGGEDVKLLSKRFERFAGVSETEENVISTGIERISEKLPMNKSEVADFNEQQFQNYLDNVKNLREKWMKAVGDGTFLQERLQIPSSEEGNMFLKRKMYYNKTIKSFSAQIIGILFVSVINLETIVSMLVYYQNVIKILSYIVMGLVFSLGIPTYKYLKLYFKYHDITKDISNIANALVDSLYDVGIFKTARENVFIKSEITKTGEIFIEMSGGTTQEQNLFLKSMEQIISVPENPRYIIERKGKAFNLIPQIDYHSVPEVFGNHQKSANVFLRNWKKYVGDSQLHFTRNLQGRKILLHARFHSLAQQLNDLKPERKNVWE